MGPPLRAPALACTLAVAAAAADPAGLIYERRVFPEDAPLVCATFISHHRFDLLERTMAAAMRHFDEDEPSWLTYEIAWFDNGSGEAAAAFAARAQVERARLSEHNLGLPAAINWLYRTGCRAPYLLTLEEDWEYGGDSAAGPDWAPSPGAPAVRLLETSARRTAVAAAAALLAAEAADPRGLAEVGEHRRPILGVTLRAETLDMVIREPRRSAWRALTLLAPPAAGAAAAYWVKSVEFRTYCLDWNSGQLFAAYTNGAALYNRSRLLSLGPMYGDSGGVPNADGSRIFLDATVSLGGHAFPSHFGETNFALRAGMQFCSSTLRLEPGCEGTPNNVGGTCSAAFVHTGHGRGYGLEKVKAARTPEESDSVWALVGTPMLDAALAFRRLIELEDVPQALGALQSAAGLASRSLLVGKAVAAERLARIGGWAGFTTYADGAGADGGGPDGPSEGSLPQPQECSAPSEEGSDGGGGRDDAAAETADRQR